MFPEGYPGSGPCIGWGGALPRLHPLRPDGLLPSARPRLRTAAPGWPQPRGAAGQRSHLLSRGRVRPSGDREQRQPDPHSGPPGRSLLRGVRMSTHEVLRDTVALAEAGGLSVALTPLLYDIDCLDDLRRLWVDLAESPPGIAEHTRAFLRTLKLKAAGPGFW